MRNGIGTEFLILDCSTGELLHRVSERLNVDDVSLLLSGVIYYLQGKRGSYCLTVWSAVTKEKQTRPVGQKHGTLVYQKLKHLGGTTLVHAEVFQRRSMALGLAFFDMSDLNLPPRTLVLSMERRRLLVANVGVGFQGSQVLVLFEDIHSSRQGAGVLSMKKRIQQDVVDRNKMVIALANA